MNPAHGINAEKINQGDSASAELRILSASGDQPRGVQVTATALARIHAALATAPPDRAVRITVQGGGCTGLTCEVRPDTPRERDRILKLGNIHIVVDPKSFIYLHGMTLDYSQDTFPQGFIVVSAGQATSKGCGCASVPQGQT